MSETTYDIHPSAPMWTHIALRVKDIDASISWYEAHTPLRLLDRREDEMGFGAWLGQPESIDHPFILVISQFLEGCDPFADAPKTVLGPFAHLGIELPTKEAIDEMAAKGEASGCLVRPAGQMPPPIGYICMLCDPDGNTIEYSFDQGVLATVQQVWGSR
ncbi:MAG: VOC family protein [Acidimicrobiia bacterium]|nr:VOC family protein [Acidimicrobiia bacterium]